MRPRQACLGMPASPSGNLTCRTSFNEAEASLPRNVSRAVVEFAPTLKRFNEAEASLPRNDLQLLFSEGNELHASMRPRQACLGMPSASRSLVGRVPASMRPRQACLGMLNIADRIHVRIKASMRPRQACLGMLPPATMNLCGTNKRFNEAEASLPRNAEESQDVEPSRCKASMRPRQACLGMMPYRASVTVTMSVGFNEAEASLPRNGFEFNEHDAMMPKLQ